MFNRIRKVIREPNAPIETPFYLFDELLLEKNYRILNSILGDTNCRFSIAYSIKTNPLESIVLKLKELGALAEVTSTSELQLAERCHFDEIIFNGIYKTDAEMIYAAKIGATIVLDGYNQISRISKIATTIENKIKVGIRISSFPILNDNGTRFGIYATEPELNQIALDLVSVPNIDLCCLHMHLGTNIGDPGLYQQALERLYNIGIIMENVGACICYYDLGGGMPTCMDYNWRQTFCNGINSIQGITSDPNKTLMIEAGRALVESAGFVVTRVVDIRKRVDGAGEDVVVDVGTNSILGAKHGITHQFCGIKTYDIGSRYKYRLAGPLCHADDIVSESYEIGVAIDIGDLLLITGVGAYDFSTSYEFSRDFPGVYLLDIQGNLISIR